MAPLRKREMKETKFLAWLLLLLFSFLRFCRYGNSVFVNIPEFEIPRDRRAVPSQRDLICSDSAKQLNKQKSQSPANLLSLQWDKIQSNPTSYTESIHILGTNDSNKIIRMRESTKILWYRSR